MSATEGSAARPLASADALQRVDVATVVQASQAIAAEIVVERVIERLLRAALQHAGARLGRLLLKQGAEGLQVVASGAVRGDDIEVELRRFVPAERDLPLSMVHRARRTRRTAGLEDATESGAHELASDAYLRAGAARSALCVPLLKQAELVGVLYLENDQTPAAFTPARVAVLDLLATQAAMSLENARLYDDLRRQKLYMSDAERLSHTGTFGWGPSSGAIFWSDEMFRIFETDEAPSLELWRQRSHPDDRAALEAVMADSSLLEDARMEQRLIMPDGSVKHLTIAAHRVSQPGATPEYVGSVRDVTALKRSEEALQRTQAALADVSRVASLGEMAAAIAHEVNQPLAAVGLNAGACLQWLEGEHPNLPEARDAAARIKRDAALAAAVVQRLRALFGKTAGVLVGVDVNEAVREVVTLMRGRIRAAGVSLTVELDEPSPMALGDRVQLQQVVMNLLANAAEATSERGDSSRHISLRASAAGDRVVFEVRDTGCGVAPSDAARIFEPFFSTKADGMGIGLSICKTIVERHGGDLSVRANEDGDGSTFWFTVPVAAASDAAAAAADTHAR